MTTNGHTGNVITDPHRQVAPSVTWELGQLYIIAGPLIAAYVAELSMVVTTKAVVGELGYLHLAGVGLASDVTIQLQIVLFGLLSVVGVLTSQALGAGNTADVGVAVRQGLVIAAVLGLPLSFVIWHLDVMLALVGTDARLLELMGPYVKPLSGSILPLVWLFVLRMFVASLAKTSVILVITLGAVALNYILLRGLVHGEFGMPNLGAAGAGWAKTIVSIGQLFAMLAYVYCNPTMRGYGIFRGRRLITPSVAIEILRLGLPVAGIVILEMSLFLFVSVSSSVIGPIATATYQVMMVWIAFAFKTVHGLAEAGMVRVARGVGMASLPAARRSGLVAMGFGVIWLSLLSLAPLNFPEPLVRVFLARDDPGFAQVLELVSKVLILAAFFQVFDGLQVLAALALRGLKDTVAPLWLAAVGYWLLGISCGWVLAFPYDMGAEGLWWGMAVGLTVTGTLLALRFLQLTARGRQLPAMR